MALFVLFLPFAVDLALALYVMERDRRRMNAWHQWRNGGRS